MVKKRTHPVGEERGKTSGRPRAYLEIPFASADESGAPVHGDPDLTGTRWLCFGAAVLCALFALGLPMAVMGSDKSFAPNDKLLVGLLLVLLVALLAIAIVFLLRAGFAAGAWFRVDERGFGYGAGPSGGETTSGGTGFHIAWSQIEGHPTASYDVGIASTRRSDVLSPRLTFWCRIDGGALTEHFVPLQLRGDIFRCLRFRNSKEVRVALLRGLARKGLRFHPDVFVEAGVDPESWRPMNSPRRTQWLVAIATMALIFLTVRVTWSTGQIVLCVGAILGLGYWAALASTRIDPRLSRIIIFRPARGTVP